MSSAAFTALWEAGGTLVSRCTTTPAATQKIKCDVQQPNEGMLVVGSKRCHLGSSASRPAEVGG